MPTLTRILGTLYNPLGAPITTGQLTMSLQQDMVSVDGTKVAPFSVSQDLSLTAGVFDKSVYATVGATPGGLAYLVEYDPTPSDTTVPAHLKDGYWRNWWAVPNTGTTVPLGNFVSAHRGDPYTNYMPLGGTTASSGLPDTVTIGLTSSGSSKLLVANQTLGGPNPTIRFNSGTAIWDLSQDGSTFTRIAVGTGTAGKLTKWSASGVLADSIVSESGSIVTINNTLSVPTITTVSGSLTLNPATTILFSRDVLPTSALTQNVGSQSQKFGQIWATELRLDTLVAADTLATVGGRLLVGETTNLTSDLAAGVTLAFLKHNFPTKDDIYFMEESGTQEWLKIDSWPIVAVDTAAEWFEVSGDYTATFTAGRVFQVRSSTGNNGSWTVSSVSYQAGTVRTRIVVTGNITNATADGHVAYLDTGPYLYRLVRNLEGGSDAWKAGDAMLNTAESYIDLYATSSSAGTGAGPTIIGNVRTGLTYSNVAPRWAIGNLKNVGYDSIVTDTYGAAFGDASSSHTIITPTALKFKYGSTTHATLTTNGMEFGAGNVILSSSGLFINPSSASGGGGYDNTKAVRWTTNTTYRNAIWRDDDSSALIKIWNLDHITSNTSTVVTKAYLNVQQFGTASDYSQFKLWARAYSTNSQYMLTSTYYDGFSTWQSGIYSLAVAGTPTIRMGVGSFTEFSDFNVSLTAGIACYAGTVSVVGKRLEIPAGSSKPVAYLQRYTDYQFGLGNNLYFSSGTFNLDLTTESGWLTRMLTTTDGDAWEVMRASAGANPRTPVSLMLLSSGGNLQVKTSFISKTNGVTGGYYQVNAAGSANISMLYASAVDETTLNCNSMYLSIANGAVQSTVGAAGGASALPATPVGYLLARINGAGYVIPYYNQ